MCGIWNTDVMARDKSMENGTVNNRITSEKEFEEVFRYYYRPLFLFAYGYVMDEGEAENIVQSVFTEMWEKRKNLPENLNLRAYLYSSVKHACLRYFKRLQLLDEYKKRQAEALVLSFADDDIEDDILKFSIASFDDQMKQRIEKIQKQLKPHLKLVTTGNVWFDIFYKDVNKGTTLTHLLEILKIKPEESGAFGDQMNDYEMLQTVKYGYAMANAMPPVKEVAYQVIDSNENDGVILKIKEILKGNY